MKLSLAILPAMTLPRFPRPIKPTFSWLIPLAPISKLDRVCLANHVDRFGVVLGDA